VFIFFIFLYTLRRKGGFYFGIVLLFCNFFGGCVPRSEGGVNEVQTEGASKRVGEEHDLTRSRRVDR
jgi:hypothetical protein